MNMVAGYVRTQSYSIVDMHKRETEIRSKAEQTVYSKLPLHKRVSNSTTCAICSSVYMCKYMLEIGIEPNY